MNTASAALTGRAHRTVSMLGVTVDAFSSYEEAKQVITDKVQARDKTFCVAINPEKLHRAAGDRKLQEALGRATIRICDGTGISLASWLLNGKVIPRCTGVDLFMQLVEKAETEQWRIFFLGASAESNAKTVETLRHRFPKLQVAGCQDGFFPDSRELVANVNKSQADLLFVAMGSPKQEYWINTYFDELQVRFCMGVGGSFDVVSGIAKRAPAIFRKTGTEWLHRLASHPSRARRQVALPLFAFKVLRQAVSRNPLPLFRKPRPRTVAGD